MPFDSPLVTTLVLFYLLIGITQSVLVSIFIWFVVQDISKRHEKEYVLLLNRYEDAINRLFGVTDVTNRSITTLTTTVEAIVNLAELKRDIASMRGEGGVAISGGTVTVQKDLIGRDSQAGHDAKS